MLESSQALEGLSALELISKVSQWLSVVCIKASANPRNRMEHDEFFKAIKTYATFRFRRSFATQRP